MNPKNKSRRSAKLNKTVVDVAQYSGREISPGRFSKDIIWDTEISGFGLRIYPSGEKTFVLSYRFSGRKRLMTLGKFGVLTPDEARKEAILNLAHVVKTVDPLAKRQKANADFTVRELCAKFLERHSKVKKLKSWEWDERRFRLHVNPNIGSLQASSLTYSDVDKLHQKLGKHSICEANKVVILMGTVYSRAKRWGLIDPDMPNPARGIELFEEKSRDRWVMPEELPRLAKAINDEENVFARYALWLYILTGVRKSELLTLEWRNVNRFRREIRLEDTKNGMVHYVPLSEPALVIIDQIPKLEGNPYVICGKARGRHLVNITKPWNRVKASAGVEDVRLHDLRRTVGSWLAQRGSTLHLIGRVLNHKDARTTEIYARFGQDHVRKALDDHGRAILAAVQGPADHSKSSNGSSCGE